MNKATQKVTLNGICPISASTIIGWDREKGDDIERTVLIEEAKANQVLDVVKLATTGRKFYEYDRAFRTIGNKQEYMRSWVGHRTHDFFLYGNEVIIEFAESRTMRFVFKDSDEALKYYTILCGRGVKLNKEIENVFSVKWDNE